MGKHERDRVESAERIIVKLLNGQKIENKHRNHPEWNKIISVYNHIINKYKNIVKAEHIGNNYETVGDIRIIIKKIKLSLKTTEEIYIELKFLKGGKGTLANISQDALTLYEIFDGISWSEYRKEVKHKEKIESMLNEYTYKEELTFENKGRYIRDNKNQKTNNIKEKIISYDREIKIEYINKLKEMKYNKEKLKKFTLLLLFGRHTEELIKEGMKKNINQILNKKNTYEIYYIYENKIIEKDYTEINKIIKEDLEIEFNEDKTNIIIRTKKSKINILRIVFHWKNVFQGIQTPCLNIFEF